MPLPFYWKKEVAVAMAIKRCFAYAVAAAVILFHWIRGASFKAHLKYSNILKKANILIGIEIMKSKTNKSETSKSM